MAFQKYYFFIFTADSIEGAPSCLLFLLAEYSVPEPAVKGALSLATVTVKC